MARPSHKPTSALRRKVSIAAGGGWSHEEIALALGVSRNTLEKHYAAELTTVAFQRRLEAIEGLHKAAKKGNAAAAKAYAAMTPRVAAPPPAEGEVPTAPRATTPEGKKAQQNELAKTAQNGTEWESILKPSSEPLQ